jgi:hypothetical protein
MLLGPERVSRPATKASARLAPQKQMRGQTNLAHGADANSLAIASDARVWGLAGGEPLNGRIEEIVDATMLMCRQNFTRVDAVHTFINDHSQTKIDAVWALWI